MQKSSPPHGHRNGKIELLRFLFCVIVMIFHGRNTMTDGKIRIMYSGRMGVEFFYIVSGYLMAVSLAKIHSTRSGGMNIARETEKFLIRKIKSLYPMVVIAFAMTITMSYISEPVPVQRLGEKIIKGLPNLFLIQQTGIQFYSINGTWYLSSMLIAMLILYPLSLKHYEFMRRIGAGLIAFLLMGYMMQNTNNLSAPVRIINGFTYRGNLRAVSEIALGMLCYEASEYIRKVSFTKLGYRTLFMVECVCYILSIWYMTFIRASKYDYFIIFALAAGITLSFSQCNYNEKIWNRPIFAKLGKASLYIYLSHLCMAREVPIFIAGCGSNKIRMVVYVILAFLAAGFLWLCSEIWRKISPKLHRLFINVP